VKWVPQGVWVKRELPVHVYLLGSFVFVFMDLGGELVIEQDKPFPAAASFAGPVAQLQGFIVTPTPYIPCPSIAVKFACLNPPAAMCIAYVPIWLLVTLVSLSVAWPSEQCPPQSESYNMVHREHCDGNRGNIYTMCSDQTCCESPCTTTQNRKYCCMFLTCGDTTDLRPIPPTCKPAK
jgi:hypothetical protein